MIDNSNNSSNNTDKIVCIAKVMGSWNFGFLGEVKIFLISGGGLSNETGGRYIFYGRSVHPWSIFLF